MNSEGRHPFAGELESLKEVADFDIKGLRTSESTVELAGGEEKS